jgi:hypothetical protein
MGNSTQYRCAQQPAASEQRPRSQSSRAQQPAASEQRPRSSARPAPDGGCVSARRAAAPMDKERGRLRKKRCRRPAIVSVASYSLDEVHTRTPKLSVADLRERSDELQSVGAGEEIGDLRGRQGAEYLFGAKGERSFQPAIACSKSHLPERLTCLSIPHSIAEVSQNRRDTRKAASFGDKLNRINTDSIADPGHF